MRVCNQELFSMIANLTGATLVQSELNEIIQCVQKHPAVTDDEVSDMGGASRALVALEDMVGHLGLHGKGFDDELNLIHAVVKRAAIAPKNCDALVLQNLENTLAHISIRVTEKDLGTIKAGIEQCLSMIAAHRAQQEGK